MPEISVIVPVYNAEKYLHRCVDSILAQTFTDFELILVDDGSTDNSGRICDDYSKAKNNIYVLHTSNGGAGKARNLGIDWINKHSDSKWICFVDSDDCIHPNFLEWMMNASVLNNCKMAICGYKRLNNNERLAEVTNSYVLMRPEDFYCNDFSNVASPCGKIYKKELFALLRYPEGIICEDAFVTYKALFMNDYIVSFETPLYVYYMSENSVMRSKWSPRRLSSIDAFQKQIEFFKENNYKQAYKKAIRVCQIEMAKQYHLCKDNGEYLEYLPIIHNRLRKHIFMYNLLNNLGIKNYEWVYDLAFPNIMKFYWKLKTYRNTHKRGI